MDCKRVAKERSRLAGAAYVDAGGHVRVHRQQQRPLQRGAVLRLEETAGIWNYSCIWKARNARSYGSRTDTIILCARTHAYVDPFAWVERITQKLIGSSSWRLVSSPTIDEFYSECKHILGGNLFSTFSFLFGEVLLGLYLKTDYTIEPS